MSSGGFGKLTASGVFTFGLCFGLLAPISGLGGEVFTGVGGGAL